jgi:hypothetical protein
MTDEEVQEILYTHYIEDAQFKILIDSYEEIPRVNSNIEQDKNLKTYNF